MALVDRFRRRWLFFCQAYEPEVAAELLQIGRATARPYRMVLISLLLAALLYRTAPTWALAAAVAGQFAASLCSLWYGRHCARLAGAVPTVAQLRAVERRGLLYGLASGLGWGSIGLLMVPGQDSLNLFAILLGTMIAGAGAALQVISAARLLALFLGGMPLMLPMLPRAFPQDWTWLILIVIAFCVLMFRNSQEKSRIIAANIQLRRRQEQLLQEQRLAVEEAQRANREKSAFLAATSHDLRQPLHALMLTSHALSLRLSAGEPRIMVERILDAGRALSEQFNALMDLSRLESGEYRLQVGRFVLAPLLQRTLAARGPVAEARNLRLSLRIDRRLRAAALQSDAALLARILDNFLDNAIKFSPRGRRILLAARLRDARLELAVYDQGIGIAAEARELIFKPYMQLDNPTRDTSQGIGLGLSIAQGAAVLLGARILLSSVPGRGSQFTLGLPAELIREALPDPAVLPPVSSQGLQGRQLLLVEDDARAAAALAAWLQGWGLRVMHHADPREVPEDLAPELIICDLRLPGERDGIHWLTQWLGQWPEARGLLLSGEVSAAQQAEQEGLVMLAKPVEPELLLRALVGMVGA